MGNWWDKRSVGFKLTVIMVVTILGTAALFSGLNFWLARRQMRDDFHRTLERQLQTALAAVARARENPELGPNPTVWALTHLQRDMRLRNVLFYALERSGRVVGLPPGPGWPLPDPEQLLKVAWMKGGQIGARVGDRQAWLVFRRLPEGDLVLVAQGMLGRLSGAGEAPWRWQYLAGLALLCLLVAWAGSWLAGRDLVRPLLKLTRQAEEVAAGKRTSLEPIYGHRDELGRLSVALALMTGHLTRSLSQAERSRFSFQQFFNETREGAFISRADGTLEDANQAMAEMFGYARRDQILGLSSTRELFDHPLERERYLEEVKRTGYVKDYPFTGLRADGGVFQGLLTAGTRAETGGRFGFVRDVTDENRTQSLLKESERRYRRLIENTPGVFFRYQTAPPAFDYLSPAVEKITGHTREELNRSGLLLFRLVHRKDRRYVLSQWRRLLSGQTGSLVEQEYRLVNREGKVFWLHQRSRAIFDAEGRVLAVEGFASDITSRKRMEKALRTAGRLVESVLQGLPVAVMVVDRDHRIVHWNRAMERLSGFEARRMIGTNRHWEPFHKEPRPVLVDLVLERDREALRKYYQDKGLKESKLVEGGYEAEDYLTHIQDGPRHLYFLAAPILDEEGQVVLAVETLVDFTDKRRLEEELRRLSVTDELTSLYNKRFFDEALEREVAAMERYGHQLALLMMDLDFFKKYNDRYGHPEGDTVLSSAAAAVLASIRSTDLACRYGGEEFAVLLPRSDRASALAVAERIRHSVASMVFTPTLPDDSQEQVSITTSVGVALHQPHQSAAQLVNKADQALYEAKRDGRNRVALHLNEQNKNKVIKPH